MTSPRATAFAGLPVVLGDVPGLQGLDIGQHPGDHLVAGNLHHTATLIAGGYAGAGLSFGVCATAAAHNAVQFSITGSLGGCALEFQAQTYSEQLAQTAAAATAPVTETPAADVSAPAAPPAQHEQGQCRPHQVELLLHRQRPEVL